LLTCRCSRLTFADGAAGILVAATEPAGPTLPVDERLRRLFEGFEGPFAAFSSQGSLIHAAPDAARLLGNAGTLAAAGAADLAAAVFQHGQAAGDTPVGRLTLERFGTEPAALFVTIAPLPEPEIPAPSEEPAMPEAGERAQPSAETTVAETPTRARDATRGTVQEHAEPADQPEPVNQAPPHEPIASQVPQQAAPQVSMPERRQPLRFVWQIDEGGRFTVTSDAFIELLGPGLAAKLGRPWAEVAAELGLDPEGRLAAALASHDTFSSIAVAWPVEGTSERLHSDLSGLPVLDHARAFHGYRGFGVCRDIARVAAIAASRRAPFVPAREAPGEAPPKTAPKEDSPRDQAATSAKTAHNAPATPPATGDRAPETSPETTAQAERPVLTVVPPAKNVVPFRSGAPTPAEKRPVLTPVERNAFQEIAKALGARVEGGESDEPEVAPNAHEADGETGRDTAETAAEPLDAASIVPDAPETKPEPTAKPETRSEPPLRIWPRLIPSAYAAGSEAGASRAAAAAANGERAVLDRLPIAALVYRDDRLLHANRALLDWTGYEDLAAIAAAGGLDRLFAEPGLSVLGEPGGSGQNLAITTRRGEALAVEARLFSVPWHDGTALLIVLTRAEAEERVRAAQEALRSAETRAKNAEIALAASDERLRSAELGLRSAETAARELESVLETATDGVVVVDREGLILATNRSVEALFGYESHELIGRSFVDLFAPESHRTAHDYLSGLMREGVARVLNDGREVIGRVQQGGLVPLFMTIGQIAGSKFCIVFRDITQWKRAEEDLTNAKREAEKASSAKSDILARVSHEIRTPLNAIIGFAEVMMEERFGAIDNERYRQYLKDIRTSGEHVMSLVNDLLDLSKIEAGKLELNFVSVSLNDVIQQCVAIMQPQANRERIIIRTSLLPTLPPVVADERSIRQIVLNLLSNSIKFTGAGGQVIVSTALTDQGEAVLRVRDTGIGMSEKEIETALEPFRQVATSGRSASGTGLGLPLTKVLAEANRATFTIKSAVDAGTLVEISFPATRVLAE
jgi:PAS domain S-box-containing protein